MAENRTITVEERQEVLFSDDEKEANRMEKRYKKLLNIIKQIRSFKKFKDMFSVVTAFDEIERGHAKAMSIITEKERGQTPSFYVKCYMELEDFVTDVWDEKDRRKNMSKNNSKSLSVLRQKLQKFMENPDEEGDEPRGSGFGAEEGTADDSSEDSLDSDFDSYSDL